MTNSREYQRLYMRDYRLGKRRSLPPAPPDDPVERAAAIAGALQSLASAHRLRVIGVRRIRDRQAWEWLA